MVYSSHQMWEVRALIGGKRRIAAWLLCALMLLGSCLPHAFADGTLEESLTLCPFVMQRDQRFKKTDYYYLAKRFSKRGCGPASIANALGAVLGLQDADEMDSLLLELMKLLPYNHLPKSTPVDVTHIDRLETADAETYPTIAKLRTTFNGLWICRTDFMTAPEIMLALAPAAASGKNVLFATRFRTATQWADLVGLCERLQARGFGSARVTIAFLSTGTESTSAPFRLEDGHYISFCLEVEEFLQRGVLYLLESNPRALPNETLDQVNYYSYYPLGRDKKLITDVFQLTRVKDTLVKLEPTPAQQLLFAQAATAEDLRTARTDWLSRLVTFGTGIVMVNLQQNAEPAAP